MPPTPRIWPLRPGPAPNDCDRGKPGSPVPRRAGTCRDVCGWVDGESWRWLRCCVRPRCWQSADICVKTQQDIQADQRNRAEFVAAAKQVVVTLMSIDVNNPQESVQQIVDNSTDPFRAEFQRAADDFIKVAKDAKVTTKAAANAAAAWSVTADSAVVLVSATSTVTNEAGVNEEPRSWRLTVDLKREGDRIKMAKVEFVP